MAFGAREEEMFIFSENLSKSIPTIPSGIFLVYSATTAEQKTCPELLRKRRILLLSSTYIHMLPNESNLNFPPFKACCLKAFPFLLSLDIVKLSCLLFIVKDQLEGELRAEKWKAYIKSVCFP